MKTFMRRTVKLRLAIAVAATIIIFALTAALTPAFSRPADDSSDATLLEGYRHVEVASF